MSTIARHEAPIQTAAPAGRHYCATCDSRHWPCAICDQDDSINRICAACRRRPENALWGDRREALLIEADENRHGAVLCSGLSPRSRPLSPLQRHILDLMVNYTVGTWVRRRVRRKGQRVWEWRRESRALAYREIAWLLDCSKSYCEKTYHRVAG